MIPYFLLKSSSLVKNRLRALMSMSNSLQPWKHYVKKNVPRSRSMLRVKISITPAERQQF